MIRRPPRSTLDRSSAASDVYKRQIYEIHLKPGILYQPHPAFALDAAGRPLYLGLDDEAIGARTETVSYTHLRAHETVLDLVCRLLLEKKKKKSSTQLNVVKLT